MRSQEGTSMKPPRTRAGTTQVSAPQSLRAKVIRPISPVHSEESCAPVRKILTRVGDKWSILTIMLLKERPFRFGELRRSIEGISQRMLTLTLRGLERDGLVSRTVFPTNPPQVEYALTDLGCSLCEPVYALGRWAYESLPDIDAARQDFDRQQQPASGVSYSTK